MQEELVQSDTITALAEQTAERTVSARSMIVFDGVSKIYEPNVAALRDVSFIIDKGEFVFLVGPSGSGKSTAVRMLLKEVEPTSGRVIVSGRDLGRLRRSKVPMLRRNVGCVFQDFKLLPNRSAYDNVAGSGWLTADGMPRHGVKAIGCSIPLPRRG